MNFAKKITATQINSLMLLVFVLFFKLTLLYSNNNNNTISFKSQKETTSSHFEKKSDTNFSISPICDDVEEELETQNKATLSCEVHSNLFYFFCKEKPVIEFESVKKFYHKKSNLYLLFCNLKLHFVTKQEFTI